MFQPKTLYESIKPLIVANFIVGMEMLPAKTVLRKVINIMYSISCLVVFSIYTTLYMRSNKNVFDSNTSFGNLAFSAVFYGNICLISCLVIIGWWKIKVMQIAFVNISMCEEALEQLKIRKNYRQFYLHQIYALGIIVVIFIVFFSAAFTMYRDVNTPLYTTVFIVLAMLYPLVLLYVADVSFLHWVRYAKVRFKQLNDLLQGMLSTTPDSPQHKRVLKMRDEWNKTFVASEEQQNRTKDNTNTIRAVKQVHLALIKCIRTANEAYGIQMLFSMTVSFVMITTLLYEAYKVFFSSTKLIDNQQEIIMLICWILFYASKIFIINHLCALATIEAANTGDIICELYEPSTSKEFRAEIRDFTLQLIQNPLIFTACGFFNLDHTFIHGVIGSITTYLVILIQVGDITQPSANNTATATTTMWNLTNFAMTEVSVQI